jgi:hypothetical protein
LLVAYEAVQCLQWHVLLRPLGTHESLRAQVFAFLVGAATRALPIGNFGQKRLLALLITCKDTGRNVIIASSGTES